MSEVTSLINYNFGGIRRKDSVFSADKITCSDCQNVELYYTKLNSGVGIRTANGNKSITDLIPSDENVIGMFESIMLGKRYFLVYTENETQGKLYNYSLGGGVLTNIISGLSVTGKACGTDFQQGWTDMFIFSNGIDMKYIYGDSETGLELQVCSDSELTLKDVENRDVYGLGLIAFDGRLWVFNGKVLWYSQQENCKDFSYVDTEAITSAGYIEFVKDITAIYPYLGTLAVFHKDSSVLIQSDSDTTYSKSDESPGGCASYNSLVFAGTDLYFYDNTKKGVFSFKQIINGDKTLGDNIALDIQEELMDIDNTDLDKIKGLYVVTSDRNEIWFLVPISNDEDYSIVLIYDYLRGEWIKRKCQNINCVFLYNSKLYSAGETIYEEYVGKNFNGKFIEAFYECTVLNLGADNTLKITKFPPRLTLDSQYNNKFYIKYIKNYNTIKTPKIKYLTAKSTGNILKYDSGDTYDSDYIYIPAGINSIVKMPSATFKALAITFYTQALDQEFCIKAVEFSKIKVKQI